MNLSEARPIVQSAQPATELIALALLSPELARQNLRALLLSNPNYFGRITGNSFKAVLKIEKDTTFENIGSVGYNSRDETLRATIQMNQSMGYSGANYGQVSQEFVRFYLSYDEGSTWNDQGLYAVKVYDMQGPKPMRFTVSAGIDPARTFCFMRNLPMVRVILSWNSPPPADTPGWSPVWGEVVDTQVEFDERSVGTDECGVELANEPMPGMNSAGKQEMMQAANLERTIEASRLKVLGLAELVEHYSIPIPLSRESTSKAS